MATDQITDVEFPGAGPFAIPLLAKLVSLDIPDNPDFVVVRFEFEDHSLVYVPIATQVLVALKPVLAAWEISGAQREADQSKKH